MKCPQCREDLLKLPVKIDGQVKEIWTHRFNPLKKCIYSDDGVKVETEVTDFLLMQKFQELIAEQPSEIIVTEQAKMPGRQSNLEILQRRLAKGKESIESFKAKKELV